MKNKYFSTRHFNHIKDEGDYYLKSSKNSDKIQSEINYYSELDSKLKSFHPKFLGKSKDGKWDSGYKVEKINFYDCSVLHCRLVKDTLDYNKLFKYINQYFDTIKKIELSKREYDSFLKEQIIRKHSDRYKLLEKKAIFNDINKIFQSYGGLYDFFEQLNKKIKEPRKKNQNYYIWQSHGDLCFSNIILYNDKLYLFDPKGYTTNPYFIPEYDIAKLEQSIIYGYDYINHDITKEPSFEFDKRNLITSLCEKYNISQEFVRLITISHFLTMLPFHSESEKKVIAFAKVAKRIFENE